MSLALFLPFYPWKAWLTNYILGLESAEVQNFLRFVTGLATVKATSESDDPSITIEVYTDLEGCAPTASTCSKKFYLPAYAEHDVFKAKMKMALDEFRISNSNVGGAEMTYE